MTTQNNITIQIIETKIFGQIKYNIYSNIFDPSNPIIETTDYTYILNYICNYINQILYTYNYIIFSTNKTKYFNDITEYYFKNTSDLSIYSKLIYVEYIADTTKSNSIELIQTHLNELKTEFLQYELYSNLSGLSINNCIIGKSKSDINSNGFISNIVKNIFKSTQPNQQTEVDTLTQLNQNLNKINSKLLELFPESINSIQENLIELPKPYKFTSDKSNFIRNCVQFDFTNFYVSILLEFNLLNQSQHQILEYLVQLWNSEINGIKLKSYIKPLLVSFTGLLNWNKGSLSSNNSNLYDPFTYYIMIYISRILIQTLIEIISKLSTTFEIYFSQTDSIFYTTENSAENTTEIINYVYKWFENYKYIKLHHEQYEKIIIKNYNLFYKYNNEFIVKLKLGSNKITNELKEILNQYYETENENILNLDQSKYSPDLYQTLKWQLNILFK